MTRRQRDWPWVAVRLVIVAGAWAGVAFAVGGGWARAHTPAALAIGGAVSIGAWLTAWMITARQRRGGGR